MTDHEILSQDIDCFALSLAEFGLHEFMTQFKKSYPQEYESFLVQINDVIDGELKDL
jgi:hypothetical protein